MEYMHSFLNLPGIALGLCSEGIWVGTSAVAFYSTDSNVLTVVAPCGPNELSSARVFINGVQLFTRAAVYANVPANIGAWSGAYHTDCARVPELVPMLGTPYVMPFYKHHPAIFKDGVMYLGDYVPILIDGTTEIELTS